MILLWDFIIIVFFYVHGKQLWSCRDGERTLFLGRLRSPNRLTSTKCTYFRQQLITAFLASAEVETKVCGRIEFQTRDLWLSSQTRYRLYCTAQLLMRRSVNFNNLIRMRAVYLSRPEQNCHSDIHFVHIIN